MKYYLIRKNRETGRVWKAICEEKNGKYVVKNKTRIRINNQKLDVFYNVLIYWFIDKCCYKFVKFHIF